MGKYRTLAKNTGFVFIGTIGSKVINFIMLPLYTKWLSPDAFGAVDTMNTYAMFIIGFVCLNIQDSIFIFPRNVNDHKKAEYLSSGLFFCLLMLAVAAVFFYAVRELMLSYGLNNVFSIYTWPIYGLMATTFLQNYFQSFTRSLDKMQHYSIAGIILTIGIALFSIILIPHHGLYGYVYALISAHIVASLYSFVAAKTYKYLTIHNTTTSSIKQMLSYSAPLLPNSIMWWLVDGVNRPVMERMIGLSAIGVYAVAQKFSGLLYSMLTILTISWGNSALDEYGKPDFDKFYNRYLKLLSFVLVFVGIVITVFSKPLVHLFTTEDYYNAQIIIPILTLGVVFSGISGAIGSIFSAIKQSKYYFYSSLYGGGASVLFLFLLTSWMGIIGTACSVAISFFVMMICRAVFSWKYARIYDIGYYFILFTAFILVIFVELYNINPPIQVVLFISILSYIIYISFDNILFFYKLLKSKKEK